MFSAGAISATMGLDAKGFFAAMNAVESVGKLFPSFVQSFLGSPLLGLTDLMKSVGGELKSMTLDYIDNAAKADKLAKSVGMDVEFFSQFSAVLGRGQSGMESAAMAFKFLEESIASAATGSKDHILKFQKLGVSIQELRAAYGGNKSNYFAEELRGLAYNLSTLPEGAAGAKVLAKHLEEVSQAMANVKGADAVRGQLAGLMQQLRGGNVSGIMEMRQQLLAMADAANGMTANLGGAERIKQIMFELMDGLKKASTGERTDLIRTILGKQGLDYLEKMEGGVDAFIARMDKAVKLNVAFSKEGATSARGWQKAVADLEMTWEGFRNVAGEEILKLLGEDLKKVSAWVADEGPKVREWIRGTLKDAVSDVKELGDALHHVKNVWDLVHGRDPARKGDNKTSAYWWEPENSDGLGGLFSTKGWIDSYEGYFGRTDQDARTPIQRTDIFSAEDQRRKQADSMGALWGSVWDQWKDYAPWDQQSRDQQNYGLFGNSRGLDGKREPASVHYHTNNVTIDASTDNPALKELKSAVDKWKRDTASKDASGVLFGL